MHQYDCIPAVGAVCLCLAHKAGFPRHMPVEMHTYTAVWQICIFRVGGLESIPRELFWEHSVGSFGFYHCSVCVCVYCPKHPQWVSTAPLGRYTALPDVIHTDWGWPWKLGQTHRPTHTHTQVRTLHTLIITITDVTFSCLSTLAVSLTSSPAYFTPLGQCDSRLHQSSDRSSRRYPCLRRTHLCYSHNWRHVSNGPHYTAVNDLLSLCCFLDHLVPSILFTFIFLV